MNKFYVIANESEKGSWVDLVWSDIKDTATIYLDNNTLRSSILKKLKKIHFSNKFNRYFWLPFKGIWDKCLCIKYEELSKNDTNYLIFQSNIKFSPSFIRKIKTEKNAVVILYLPDTIHGIGIGNSYIDFARYAKYYQIDYVYSFDRVECEKYGFHFFDIYSRIEMEETNKEYDIFYIGNCRNKERLDLLHCIYKKVRERTNCNFNIVGVKNRDKKYPEINYNNSMSYVEVLKNVNKCNVILEVLNNGQAGNTFRFKEAICYNKKLITNNPEVLKSRYYSEKNIMYFENVEQIDIEWIKKNENVDYNYCGEYSPINLLDKISMK